MAAFTEDQFQQFMQMMRGSNAPTAPTNTAPPVTAAAARNDPSALGPFAPCSLGKNKMTKLTKFEEWLEEAENRMEYIGNQEDKDKIILLKSWGGSELTDFIKTRVDLVTTGRPADGDQPAVEPATYPQVIEKIKIELRRLVNRTMAMHDLYNTKQGSKSWMDYIHELEKKAKVLDFARRPYTMDEAVKDAAIRGMTDAKLSEKALAEDLDKDSLVSQGQAREAGKQDVNNLRDSESTVRRMSSRKQVEEMTDTEIEEVLQAVNVMKLQKAGRYSNRNKDNYKKEGEGHCGRCLLKHAQGRCTAWGHTCGHCQGKNHFDHACKKREKPADIRRVTGESYLTSRSTACPETEDPRETTTIRKMNDDPTTCLNVPISVGEDEPMSMYIDSGVKHTVIPPEKYTDSMGKMEEPDINFRAWGAKHLLRTVGMVQTELTTRRGARKKTKIYIVDGFNAEPLLGYEDAEELGFITISQEGRAPTECESTGCVIKKVNLYEEEDRNNGERIPKKEDASRAQSESIPNKIRKHLKKTVITHPSEELKIPEREVEKVDNLVKRYLGSVFDENKVGKIDTSPVHLEYEGGFVPLQPRFRNIPIHYQERTSALLKFLREQKVITDADPRKPYKCIMNVVITDKKDGNIRMNIDAVPMNKGLKRAKFHVQTPQEIRHELKPAQIFSEFDMGWGYHQLEIDDETKEKSIFQTHEGIHRMERGYFGPTSMSGIFHNEVRKALAGLKGVVSIHDNIAVHGTNAKDHYQNLANCLQRCKEKGITLKPSKSKFCMTRMKWFGRIFTGHGVTADPEKHANIKEAGPPTSIEDVRSLLMACQFNAKFSFDSTPGESYEDITLPLRRLLKKDAKFKWDEEEKTAYKKLINKMNDPSTLQAFDVTRATHVAADSSEHGMQGSIYQEISKDEWVPVDHTSRALTSTEQNYSPIERESLAQSWALEQFRYYLVGAAFTTWTDHEPLLPIYNNRGRSTSKRLSNHRDKVQDLEYTMKYMPGKTMPCDYGSRHAQPISHLSLDEQNALGFDNGQEIYIRRIYRQGGGANALRDDDILEAAAADREYQSTIDLLRKGKNPPKLSPYARVWDELCEIDGIIYKGTKKVIPNAKPHPQKDNARNIALEIAHDGHPGMCSMKQFAREHMWYPGLDRDIEECVETCLPCQAATTTTHRDPLVPTEPPKNVWEDLAADHWGPTPLSTYMLVIIDKLSRYPEVIEVKSTSAQANIAAFDSVFSRHGFCKTLTTDNGPPFNGKDTHELQQYFQWAGITHNPTISADDPEANGLAEAFMKIVKKVWHTCTVTGRDAMAEINKRLQAYRATPHPTTGKTPAELMYGGRPYRTRLPDKREEQPCEAVKEAQETDRKNKMKQKMYKDSRQYVKPHNLKPGDLALLSQRQTKRDPPYDPKPYRITKVSGHQVSGQRNSKEVTRDSKKWKKLNESKKEPRRKDSIEPAVSSDEEISIGSNREPRGPHISEVAHCMRDGFRATASETPATGRANTPSPLEGNIDLTTNSSSNRLPQTLPMLLPTGHAQRHQHSAPLIYQEVAA